MQALSLLLSRQAAERFGERIAAVLAGRAHHVVHLEDVLTGVPVGIEVAFLTRDITGSSSKLKLTESMQRFFEVLAASPRLAWVHTHSAGTDRPVWVPIRERGIRLTTSAGSMSGTVALSAIGGILALARRFPDLWDAQRRHAWEPLLEERAPPDLAGQTALVVGLGAIGGEIARLLRAFGVKVIGVRRTAEPHAQCDEAIAFGNLASKLPGTDWLILACPLTAATRGLVDAAALARLPRGAHVVNVSRGEVIDEAALIEALRSEHLGGAWLDVFEKEPLNPASPLWDLPRVLVSPHSSAHSTGNYDRAGDIFLDNLARWREGRPLRNDATTVAPH